MREGYNESGENFEVGIIPEDALDKALRFPKKQILNNPGILYMSLLTITTFKC